MMKQVPKAYVVTSDGTRLLKHVDAIHACLTASYWAEGIPKKTVQESMQGVICFGVLQGRELVGFCRVISDKATYAYLADVFVREGASREGFVKAHDGRGKDAQRLAGHPAIQCWSRVMRMACMRNMDSSRFQTLTDTWNF